jgi:hypothetical protein
VRWARFPSSEAVSREDQITGRLRNANRGFWDEQGRVDRLKPQGQASRALMDFYGAEISCEQFKVVIKSWSPEFFKLANVVSKEFYPNNKYNCPENKVLFFALIHSARLQIRKWSWERWKKPSAHSAPSLNPALGTIFPCKKDTVEIVIPLFSFAWHSFLSTNLGDTEYRYTMLRRKCERSLAFTS